MFNSLAGNHGVHRIKFSETLLVRLRRFYQQQLVHVRCIIITLISIRHHSIILTHLHHIELVLVLEVFH